MRSEALEATYWRGVAVEGPGCEVGSIGVGAPGAGSEPVAESDAVTGSDAASDAASATEAVSESLRQRPGAAGSSQNAPERRGGQEDEEHALAARGRGEWRGAAQPGALAAATEPRRDPTEQRMLHVDLARRAVNDRRLDALPSLVRPGDVFVLNDAATLPASLEGRAAGRDVEVRLAGRRDDGTWRAVLFGEGSWRDDTDARPAPPRLDVGATIELGPIRAEVVHVDAASPRLVGLRFEGRDDAFWRALYRVGRPIQYSYHRRALRLDEVQTAYAARPWALELPSAGRPLTGALLRALRERGATVCALTHAAGISATGDAALDARLPLPERYAIPETTAAIVRAAKREGRRVIAVGTSVTRALEGVARDTGEVVAIEAETDLVLGPRSTRRVVDAILTGAHDPTSSHHALLEAFAPRALLARALRASLTGGYRGHELGDSWLIA